MIHIRKKSLKPYVGLVTRLRHKLRREPFFAAKVKLTTLYFIIGVSIFLIVGTIVDGLIKESFYEIALNETGEPVEKAFNDVQTPLWIGRGIQLSAFAIFAYLLAIFAMKPIRKTTEMQRHFVATASHQLRTPLAIMQSGLEVALRNPSSITGEKAISILEDNLEETIRLSEIIKFLLTFSKLDGHKKSLIMEEVSLKEATESTIKLLRSLAYSKNIKVNFNSNSAALLRGNEVALNELTTNLIKNAILYTPDNGQVEVTIDADPDKIVLTVSNNGKGVDKKDLPHIFEPFYQGEAGRDSEARGGVGLGLAVAREIAHLHGATIRVESEKDKVTTFIVTFKL